MWKLRGVLAPPAKIYLPCLRLHEGGVVLREGDTTA